MNTFGARDKCIHTGDERFSAGDGHVENALLNFSHTHTATCSYQQTHSSLLHMRMHVQVLHEKPKKVYERECDVSLKTVSRP